MLSVKYCTKSFVIAEDGEETDKLSGKTEWATISNNT